MKTTAKGLIYEPAGRALEYAELACNIYRGCAHGCTYCYAPATLRLAAEQFAKPSARMDFLRRLQRDAESRAPGPPILLCFTCDPYQPIDDELQMTRKTIAILHAAGHRVEILTKGGFRSLRDLDLLGPNDRYAASLTLVSAEASATFEPHAAPPAERVETLKRVHAAGIPTWVSLEPVLIPADTLELIRWTHEFVDFYRVGKLNHRKEAHSVDWARFAQDATELLKKLGKLYYVKKDLAECLGGKS